MKKIFSTKLIALVLVNLICYSVTVYSYIPNSKWILSKWAENNNSGNVYFEQEIQLQGKGQIYFLKEQWLVDNEGSMKVLVKGSRDLADKIQFQIQYNTNIRTMTPNWMTQRTPVGLDFYEPLFFYKSPQRIVQFLVKNKILNTDISNSKNYQKVDNSYIHTPEDFIRLGRTSGVISIIFGPQPQVDSKDTKNLGVWLDQDKFFVLKIRGVSLAELNIDKWQLSYKGVYLPKDRTYLWEDKIASAKLGEAKPISASHRLIFNKPIEMYPPDFDDSALKELLLNFYSKFR